MMFIWDILASLILYLTMAGYALGRGYVAIDWLFAQCPRDPAPRNHSNLPAPPMALPMASPHAHISRIRVFIFPSMHLIFSRWRCLDWKLLASEQQSTNQWVTSQMLRLFLLYD